jgi:uncharacterized protein (TIGR03435 family)
MRALMVTRGDDAAGRALILWMIGIASMGVRIAAEQAVQAPPGPSFEVASVKPNKSGPGAVQRAGVQPGDRVTMTNVTLRTLIQVAYPGVSEIVGGPGWVGSGPAGDRFDVNAKAEGPASREQLQLMLRTLLADRFKLAVHTESRDEPVFALVFARSDRRLGPNLRPAATDCAALRAAAASSGAPDPCGLRTFTSALMTGRMSVRGMGLDQILGLLSRDAGRKIVDKTGLSGAFDCELTWTPQVFLQRTFDRERFASIDPDGPSIFTAVQEQLGLKLESTKGPVEVLVIDHAEHPTED